MRVFDWRSLLAEQRIPHIERGANVKRGELNIKCPFCASADPSFHLGINLDSGYWACWRNSNHRGKSPLRLLVQLLKVPYWRARQLAGLSDDYVDPEGFDAVAARLLNRGKIAERPEQVKKEFLQFDRHFVPITDRVRTRRFWNYLYDRGFHERDVDILCNDYQLMAAVDGKFRDRVIVPYFLDTELVTWSGRAIADAEIRYKDLSRDESLIPPKEMLLGGDCIPAGGKVLVIVEGPFDYLKLDYYGKAFGVRAVALSTNSISEEQIYQLQEATDQFDLFVSMMDTATATGVVDSMRLKQELYFLPNLKTMPAPFDYKDAGGVPANLMNRWARQLAQDL